MSSFPEIELVFVSGLIDPVVWKHQEKYFSRNCEVTLIGGGSFEELKSELKNTLENTQNAVVVGAELGNHVVQSMESHDNVMSTVVTGPFDQKPFLGEYAFRFWNKTVEQPKFCRKAFFNSKTRYNVVKEMSFLLRDLDFEDYKTFLGRELRVPMKNSLIIYNQSCRFSTMGGVEDLKPNSEIALLNAGVFSFFEKPQEYNKALHDYLLGKREFVERREVVKNAAENRSLKDFEDKLGLKR